MNKLELRYRILNRLGHHTHSLKALCTVLPLFSSEDIECELKAMTALHEVVEVVKNSGYTVYQLYWQREYRKVLDQLEQLKRFEE